MLATLNVIRLLFTCLSPCLLRFHPPILIIQAVTALKSIHGTQYVVGSSADLLYPSAGGSDDWANVKAGIRYVYLLEMRPDQHYKDGFILPENQVIPPRAWREETSEDWCDLGTRRLFFLRSQTLPEPHRYFSSWLNCELSSTHQSTDRY